MMMGWSEWNFKDSAKGGDLDIDLDIDLDDLDLDIDI